MVLGLKMNQIVLGRLGEHLARLAPVKLVIINDVVELLLPVNKAWLRFIVANQYRLSLTSLQLLSSFVSCSQATRS